MILQILFGEFKVLFYCFILCLFLCRLLLVVNLKSKKIVRDRMGEMKKNQQSNWWWLDSHSTTKRSPWLQSTLTGNYFLLFFSLFWYNNFNLTCMQHAFWKLILIAIITLHVNWCYFTLNEGKTFEFLRSTNNFLSPYNSVKFFGPTCVMCLYLNKKLLEIHLLLKRKHEYKDKK